MLSPSNDALPISLEGLNGYCWGRGPGGVTAHLGSSCRRFVQNPTGGDYGHHMSRAACNIGAVLMSQELKAEGIPVLLLHVRLLIG